MAIPVTILSGSLGAGKTTLLNHLLAEAGERDVAVLVNDMGELNVDAELVSRSESASGGVAELSNGCICCELRDDLETAVVRLAREREFDHLVVEASGISEPEPIARLFTTRSSAAARYEVDALVTVVDARQFYDAFGAAGRAERHGADDGDETRPLSDLLVEQVEFSNLVVVNKCDLVSAGELAAVEEMIAALRPDAEVVRATFGEVAPDRVLDRGLYDADTAAAAGWKRSLEGDDAEQGADHDCAHDHDQNAEREHDHDHPEEEYGVTSFVYRRRRPFHPGRFADLVADLPQSVVRSKGTCWVAGREDHPMVFGQAGPSAHVEASGRWIASLPEADQDLYRSNRRTLEWDEEWGDRRTELVVIGRGVDEAALTDALDDCLLADEEMAADWSTFENPFPDTDGELIALASP